MALKNIYNVLKLPSTLSMRAIVCNHSRPTDLPSVLVKIKEGRRRHQKQVTMQAGEVKHGHGSVRWTMDGGGHWRQRMSNET